MAVSAKPIAETSLCSCLFIGYLKYPDTLQQGVFYSASHFHSVYMRNEHASVIHSIHYIYIYIYIYILYVRNEDASLLHTIHYIYIYISMK